MSGLRVKIISPDGTTYIAGEMEQTGAITSNGVTPTVDNSTSATSFSSALEKAEADLSGLGLKTVETYEQIFREAATIYGVDYNLLVAMAKQESGFNASAVSSSGAVGVMQLMPETAAGLGVSNSYDAYENIMGGAKYIRQLLDKYNGDTSLALAAYNAGSGNVDLYGGIPPFTETQNYVSNILSMMESGVDVPVKNYVKANRSTEDAMSDAAILLEQYQLLTSGKSLS